MKVILKERVAHVGEAWEVKDVANGYARNFLFPRHLAEPATRARVAHAQEEYKKHETQREQDLGHAKELATGLEGTILHVSAAASEEGTLFGSVDEKAIREALVKENASFSDVSFTVNEPIKTIGEHARTLTFRGGAETHITVIVTNEL